MRVCLILLMSLCLTVPAAAEECVILLHGLARTKSSMANMARALEAEGYRVINTGYPSRKYEVEQLAIDYLPPMLDACRTQGASPVNFVTHSLGGILLRQFMEDEGSSDFYLGRVVMLSPPNQGSEVVDNLRNFPGFRWLNGPAGRQLGTGEQDLPRSLGPADFELGIITGSRSINLILSQFLPNPDDGKVSVDNARLEGMCAFLVLPVSHPFIMGSREVIAETLHFLRHGDFSNGGAENGLCGPDH